MSNESILAIKERLALITDSSDPYFVQLRQDSRKGVQKLIVQWENKQQKTQALKEKYLVMSQFEQALWQKNVQLIAGLDEVGRGPLAGPVVAAAVILPSDCQILGLNDSKQLSAAKRQTLLKEIQQQAVAIGIGVVDQTEIDRINIYQASKQAMTIAVTNLAIQPEHLLIDAMNLELAVEQTKIIKGDARSISIAAASIVAKEIRDQMMSDYHELYPHYGFKNNAGYGTKEHLTGLATHGITPIHRKTFAPVKNYL
ncbi:MAG: ribonuclease HII [Enterococcus sp.]